jgi:hypothetical protein
VYFGLIRSFFGRQQEIEPPRRQARKAGRKTQILHCRQKAQKAHNKDSPDFFSLVCAFCAFLRQNLTLAFSLQPSAFFTA